MPEYRYAIEHALRSCDCDARGFWRYSSAQLLMQELAEEHARQFGVGRMALLEKSVVWVLARTRTEFKREARIGETVTAVTYPGNTERATFPRYFDFLDGHGDAIGHAVTLWLLVDAAAHKLTTPKKAGVEMPVTDLAAPIPHPARIRPTEAPSATLARRVCYSDLDINGHMNNARYLEWLFDAAGDAAFGGRPIAAAQLNYTAESRPGDELLLKRFDSENGYILTGEKDEKPIFEGEVRLGSL